MEFGFFLDKKRHVVNSIEVKPLPDIDETFSWFYESARVSQGWLYPHDVSARQDLREKSRNIPTELPAKWFRTNPTHSITIHPYDEKKLKFLIICFAYINGVYLAPAGHYFLEKVPYQAGLLTDVIPIDDDVEKGLNLCEMFYDRNPSERTAMFAVLHWFLVGQSYEFPWDRFEAQYKVLDGLYKISGENARNHAHRAVVLANKYGIHLPDWADTSNNRSSKLSELRNSLVHEAIYADHPIGYNHPSENYDLFFRRFNSKLIASMLGFESVYLQSDPTDRQQHPWRLLNC